VDAEDAQNFLKVDRVDVDVKNLSIKLLKSNHKLLFNVFKGMMIKVLRPAIQKAIEKAIRDQVSQFDSLLYQIKVEADRALEAAQDDPENAPNVYRRYATAAQKRVMQGKEKTKAAVSDKKVNYAVTSEDSIFPNIHLPGGISSKATEYKELARRGNKWESPVFSIGAASRSRDIPAAPSVTRKSHTTAANTANIGSGNDYTNGYEGVHGGPGLNSGAALSAPQGAPFTTTSF